MWKLKFQPDGALHSSLAWERYVPTVKYVHEYGCRLAFGINERKRVAGKFKEKDRHHYCGAYQLRGGAVRALAVTAGLNEVASADIIHLIEAGEIAHTDLRIVLRPGIDVEGTKTAIVDRLWNACSGPLRHIYDYDHNMLGHANSKLIRGPLGEYRARFCLFRIWCIIRFRILRWLWLNSTPPAAMSSDSDFGRRWLRIKIPICNRLWKLASQN